MSVMPSAAPTRYSITDVVADDGTLGNPAKCIPNRSLTGVKPTSSILTERYFTMPQLTVQQDGQTVGQYEVPQGKRLVKALVEEAGSDQLHACGGHSRCTTCRVKFVDGEPDKITEAEKETLRVREVTDAGVRLSCQIACEADMTVEIISRLEGSGRQDQGSPVADAIEPDPVWTQK